MCGLFGFLNYSGKEFEGLKVLTNSLATESAVRGTDATGIAFNGAKGMCILKDSKSAYQMNFKHPDNVGALVGHTRHRTCGSRKNLNNHPFAGRCRQSRFALAHNGVLYDTDTLKTTFSLPNSRIETDSYVAAQLLEHKGYLDLDSVKFVAENIKGSFSLSVLTSNNDIFLVRGDNPLSIIRFPNLKMIVFASTDEILYKAISGSKLIEELKKGNFEEIEIKRGEILKLCADGRIEKEKFTFTEFEERKWWEYRAFSGRNSFLIDDEDFDYIDDLKAVANYHGYSPDTIDDLLSQGFSPFEIEGFLYDS